VRVGFKRVVFFARPGGRIAAGASPMGILGLIGGFDWVRFGFDSGAPWCALARGVGTFRDILGQGCG